MNFGGKYDDTEEYHEWKEKHREQCSANHKGSAGKMEVDAVTEMFAASEEKYGIRYKNYIGDGDSKTYKGILDSKPYGDVIVKKKNVLATSKNEWVRNSVK